MATGVARLRAAINGASSAAPFTQPAKALTGVARLKAATQKKQMYTKTTDTSLAPVVAMQTQNIPAPASFYKMNQDRADETQGKINTLNSRLTNLTTLDSLASRTGSIDGRSRADIQAEIDKTQTELKRQQEDWKRYAGNTGQTVAGRLANATISGIQGAHAGTAGALQTGVNWLADKLENTFGPIDFTPETNAKLQEIVNSLPDVNTIDEDRAQAQQRSATATEGTRGVGKFALEGVQSIANMATGAATGYALGIPFTAAMGIQAGGNAALDAKDQGKTIDQQLLYGATSGLASGLIESVAGVGASKVAKAAAGKLVSGLLSKLPASITTWVSSSGAKVAGRILSDAVGEGLEETADYSVNVFLQNLILDNDTPYDVKQMAYQTLQGGAIGGLFGAGQVAVNGTASAEQPADAAQNATTPTAQPTQAPITDSATVDIPAQQNATQSATGAQNTAQVERGASDWEDAAFIKVDGSIADFDNYAEHYTLAKTFGGNPASISDVIDAGTIRVKPNAGLEVSAFAEPTRSQYNKILNYIKNYDAQNMYIDVTENGLIVQSLKYENVYDVKPEKIINDLKRFYGASQANTVNAGQTMPEGMGAASLGMDVPGTQMNTLIDKYGAIKQGETPITTDRVVELPKRTSDDKVVMQTVRTAMEAQATTNEVAEKLEQAVLDKKFSREVNTDKGAVARAESTITDKGYDLSLRDWTAQMRQGKSGKDNIALGWTLYNNAANSGNGQQAVEILTDMVDNIRMSAQTVQAVRLLKKMEPQYQLYAAQRSVSNFQAELVQKYGEKAPNLKISDQFAQDYLDALFAKDDAKAKQAMENIYKNIASQIPATFADKWNAWRYTAMLFNPITHIKNIVSNTVFRGERFIKSVLSASAQTVANKTVAAFGGKGFEQTRALALTAKDAPLIEEAAKYYVKDVDAILRYGKYDDAKNRIEEYKKIFNFTPLEWARRTNTELLNTEDNWVSKPAYIKALAGYLKANGLTFQTADTNFISRARGFAILESQKSSYRDANAFSDFVSNVRYRGNNRVGKAANLLVEGIVPFRRTPANVLVRGVEYSPIGLLKTLTVDSAKLVQGKINASEYIDNLSEGLTGTALTGLGVLLSSLGILTVGGTGDEKEDSFKKGQGNQYFAINIGEWSYTADWLTPAMMPVFLGASLYNLKADEEKDGVQMKDVLKIASDITDPLLETSMLSALNDYIDGFSYAKQQDQNLLWYAISQAALNYLGQSIPTIGGRIARTIDDTRRTSFTDPKSGIPNDIQYFLQNQLGKIPFAESTKQPYVDMWGRTQSNGTTGQKLIQNFISPGYLKQITTTPMETELDRLYKDYAKENEVNVLPPTSIKKYFANDGKDVYMTAEEYTQYKITSGQYAFDEITKLTASAAYGKMTDEEKADAVSNVWSSAAETAKTEVIEGRGEMRIPTAAARTDIDEYVAAGLSEQKAYDLYGSLKALKPDPGTDKVSNYQKISVIEQQGLSAPQKLSLIGSYFTTYDDNQNVKDESLLPYLSKPNRLVALYLNTKDNRLISMVIPYDFTQNKVEYVLTDAERKLFKTTYTKFFNSIITEVSTAEQINKLRDKAYESAKAAVLSSRQ